MLKSKETGLPIKHYLGAWILCDDNVSFEAIETTDTFELYAGDGVIHEVTDDGTFIGMCPRDQYPTMTEAYARLIRRYWNSNKISHKCQQALKKFYNDYYKYDDFFVKIE